MATVLAQKKPLDDVNMDKSVRPQDDFNRYANGKWLAENPVPAEYTRWGVFEQLGEKNNIVLREIMEEAAADPGEKGSNRQKVGDFWKSAMNEERLEADGASPLKPVLAQIQAITDKESLVETISKLHCKGLCPLWGLAAEGDMANSSLEIAWIDQGGLGMPDRDYYLLEAKAEHRKKYEEHVARMFELVGKEKSKAQAAAALVMKLETQLAEASLTMAERRDPQNIYHKMSLDELQAQAPQIDWHKAFATMGAADPGPINVMHPPFMKLVAKLLDETSIAEWKDYLTWHVAHASAVFLSKAFVDEHFEFFGKFLTGQQELKPRWKRALNWANSSLGEMVGEVYCQRQFPEEAKTRARDIVSKLREALRERISALEWMEQETKDKALKKLDNFGVKIGFPDKWIDYSSLTLDDGCLLENQLRANEFEHHRQCQRMNKPVDPTRWEMAPQTINAYFHPLRNEIVFPAAILQFPMFSPEADDAVNYGAMGAVIGHEMTHGYDDQGRKFDSDGNMVDWWTANDATKFTEQAEKIVAQFSAYEVHGTNVNGELTQGENIADLGGMTIAFAALQKQLAQNGRPADIDGFSAEQRFFLSWAQVWRSNIRPESAKERLVTDPHSPEALRIKGPLCQFPEFHAAFDIKEGDPMFLPVDKRTRIW